MFAVKQVSNGTFCHVLFISARYIQHIIDNEWCTGYRITVLAKISTFMNGNWQVTIFYDYPLEIVSHWNAVLVSHNKFSECVVTRYFLCLC